jgi:NADH:flavin oxidoreductase / NADH oxidase family
VMSGIRSSLDCADSMRSNGSRWGDASRPASIACLTEMGRGSNPARWMAPRRSLTASPGVRQLVEPVLRHDLPTARTRNRAFVGAVLHHLPGPTGEATVIEESGLIIFEAIRVHPSSIGRAQGVIGYDPRCVPAFRRVAEAVHAHDTKLFGQIVHVGRHAEGYFGRTATWGASPIPWAPGGPIPHEMNEDDMAEVVAGHVRTARHLREAELDGLEVHFGHGHLLQQFLSPASNVRADAYGGSEANRLRFPLLVLQAVREAMGPAYPVGIRISAEEFMSPGLSLTDMQRIVPVIAAAVPIDFVNVSHSAYHASYSLATQMADMHFPRAAFRNLPAGIKAVVPLPGEEDPRAAAALGAGGRGANAPPRGSVD